MRFRLQGFSFRKFLGTLLFFLTIGSSAQAQLSQRTELGFGIGTFNYTGDLSRSYNFAFSKPAFTVIYRSNFSKVVSLRTSITGGKLGASDKVDPLDAFAVKRASSFNIFLLELSGVFEYHFLDWRDEKRHLRFTPYLFGGVGLFSITGNAPKNAEYSNVQVSIPFGGGLKYVLNPNWYIALDLGIRKTFFDYLDNVSGGNPRFKNYQYGSDSDLDNYFFFGVTLTRTFYDIPCAKNPY